jgi:hypothetical protein
LSVADRCVLPLPLRHRKELEVPAVRTLARSGPLLPRRTHRGRHQHRRRQHLPPHARCDAHQPAQALSLDAIAESTIEDAQLDMLSARPIAQRHAMPTWKRGDEFKAARQRALAALDGR